MTNLNDRVYVSSLMEPPTLLQATDNLGTPRIVDFLFQITRNIRSRYIICLTQNYNYILECTAVAAAAASAAVTF